MYEQAREEDGPQPSRPAVVHGTDCLFELIAFQEYRRRAMHEAYPAVKKLFPLLVWRRFDDLAEMFLLELQISKCLFECASRHSNLSWLEWRDAPVDNIEARNIRQLIYRCVF